MTTPSEKNNLAKLEWFAAVMVTFIILWLHVHFWQNAGGLWRDEVNTVNLAQRHSLAAMSHDSFPILMPLLVGVWSMSGLGRTDLELRFLGMIFGLAIPAAFWVIARVTRQPPLFSLVLFGLNALLICYGDSLRAYGLGSALIVFALVAMWSFLKKPTWPRTAILALVATLSVQTLFQNAVLFFAVCLGGFAICARRKDFSAALKIFCAGLVAAISLLPYYANFAAWPETAVELRRGFSTFILSLNFEMATGFPFVQFAAIWKMLAVIVIGLALLSLRKKNSTGKIGEKDLPLLAGATLATVTVLFIAFLWFANAGARPWYFLPPLALAAVCFDFGISFSMLPRLVRVSVFGFLIGTALMAAPAAHSDLRGHFTNADRIAQKLTVQASPQDLIIVAPWFCGVSFSRYFHGPATWETLPPLADHSIHRYDLVLKQMQATHPLAPLFEKITATLQSGHRVWLVGLRIPKPGEAPEGDLPPPPLKNSGWSDTPYFDNWAAQTVWFLNQRSRQYAQRDDDGDSDIYFQERFQILSAEGWKSSDQP